MSFSIYIRSAHAFYTPSRVRWILFRKPLLTTYKVFTVSTTMLGLLQWRILPISSAEITCQRRDLFFNISYGKKTRVTMPIRIFPWSIRILRLLMSGLEQGMSRVIVWNKQCCSPHRIWLLSLAKRLPSSFQLNGFDISVKQYPAALPANVLLQIADALQDPPFESIGGYDFVHVRLFMGVISDNNPLPLLRHCMKLLSRSAISSVN